MEFNATFEEDPQLELGAWAIDGEVQGAQFSESALAAALEGRTEPAVITASMPASLSIRRVLDSAAV